MSASDVESGGNTVIASANNEVNVTSALETNNKTTLSKSSDFSDISTELNRGRASLDFNMSKDKEITNSASATNKSSNITSGNDLTINANNDLNVGASNLTAANNVTLASADGNVNVKNVANNETNQIIHEDIKAALSAGVGNSYVDAAYALDDVVKAAEDVKAAKGDVSHMKNLKNQGRATSNAVKDAKANLAMAIINYELAVLQAAKAAANAASTTATGGFYADLQLNTSTTKSTTNTARVTNTKTVVTSNNGNVTLTANSSSPSSYTNSDTLTGGKGNITQKGSDIKAANGDVNYTASNDVNIEASKDSYNYTFGSDTKNVSVVLASTNPTDMVLSNVSVSAGYQKSDQKSSSNTYNNAKTDARNITINSNNDTNVKGANVTATNDLNITTANNLNVESLQNELHAKGSSKGFNIGASSDGSVSFGFNMANNRTDRIWVDDQTTLTGQNSVTVNTTNNTDLIGALIANKKADGTDGGNLSITTKTLTARNLNDIEESSSSSFGIQVSGIGIGGGDSKNGGKSEGIKSVDASKANPVKDANQNPLGSTTISASNAGHLKMQETRATVGGGTITVTDNTNPINTDLATLNRDIANSQVITRDTITGALDIETTIDHRLVVAGYELATGAELTEQEREDGEVLQSEVIAGEMRSLPGNYFAIGNSIVDDAQDVASAVDNTFEKIFPNGISDPKVREETRELIRSAALSGDTQTLRTKIKELTGDKPSERDMEAIASLQKERDFGKLLRETFDGDLRDYEQFSDQYMLPVGIALDGTGNNRETDYNMDPTKNSETNVARMEKLYGSDRDKVLSGKIYIQGVGTEGGFDTACLTFGCGASSKQDKASNSLLKIANKDKYAKTLLFPVDVIDFSRGSTSGSDLINNINNEEYWKQGVMTRSHMMFDPVGSYGAPGNNTDIGKNFATPKNIIAIQINAANENRNLFDLQALRTSTGEILSPNWKEITLPGAHSTIGGGYAKGDQGKEQDMAFYAMETMINEAEKYGIEFKDIPQNQRPSYEFKTAMDMQQKAQNDYNRNSSPENKFYLDDLNKFIEDKYVHDSSFRAKDLLTKDFWRIYNYDTGGQRGIYYPNDVYLNEAKDTSN